MFQEKHGGRRQGSGQRKGERSPGRREYIEARVRATVCEGKAHVMGVGQRHSTEPDRACTVPKVARGLCDRLGHACQDEAVSTHALNRTHRQQAVSAPFLPWEKRHSGALRSDDPPVTSPIDAPGLSALCVACRQCRRGQRIPDKPTLSVVWSLDTPGTGCPGQTSSFLSFAPRNPRLARHLQVSKAKLRPNPGVHTDFLRGVGSLNAECNGAGWASAAGVRSGSVRLG